MRWALVALAVAGCESAGEPYVPPADYCAGGFIAEPTRDSTFVSEHESIAVGGDVSFPDCEGRDISVIWTNRTSGATGTGRVNGGVCAPFFNTSVYRVWAFVDLLPGTNQVEVRVSPGGSDCAAIVCNPCSPWPDASPPPDTVDATTPLIRITMPSETHVYESATTSPTIGGTTARPPDGAAVLTSSTAAWATFFTAGPTWEVTVFPPLPSGTTRLTVSADYDAMSVSDYIDVTVP